MMYNVFVYLPAYGWAVKQRPKTRKDAERWVMYYENKGMEAYWNGW